MFKKLLIPIFLSITCFAQNQGNTWYFGAGAGINFNSGVPEVLTDGAMHTQEGCSAVSDVNGNVLFYTDGLSVWNSLHELMPNGHSLKGHFSSTQSALIVPKPGSSKLYYLFTTDGFGGVNGFKYSIIDMSLEDGRGDVTVVKNRMLKNNICEKITVVKHRNSNDYWILTREFETANYCSFLLTESGVTEIPIISPVGKLIGGIKSKTIGCLKASLDGTKVAAAIWDNDLVEVLDFNNETGVLSNLIELNDFYLGQPYGVEFSPSANLLYVSEANNESVSNLYQYNLTLMDEGLINERREIISRVLPKSGALQIGPDLKIYQAKMENGFLAAINNPERIGAACNYEQDAVDLLGRTSRLGLPNLYTVELLLIDLGIKKKEQHDQFAIYPNPSTGVFNYILPENLTQFTIQIYSLDGKTIAYELNETFERSGQLSINEKSGVYIVVFQSEDEIYQTKLTIK
ncbi:T9SS type A sorting domain-containing protein [Crocinitomix catalasitica]|uniref:T9SS type A sorting domain-containing protein n=1 Tax=Crocinitomix catalasitica TaxID=184607 RepID=UPI000687DF86|nr:T9SS type A sorting domain-containing protein [Crocinitomix catalasitica]